MEPLAADRRSQFEEFSGTGAGDAAVLLVDHDLRVTGCAGSVDESFGLAAAELPQRPVGALLSSRSARIAERNLRLALEHHESRTFDVRTAPPASLPLEMHTAPLLAGRSASGAIAIVRERPVTDAAQPGRGEDELAKLAAIVSHDLSEPLLLVHGYADLLRAEAADRLTPGELDQLDVICRTAKRMQALIDALLRHGEVGGATVGLELVDMEQVVAEALAMLEAHVAETGAVVRTGELVPVPGNARLLSVLVRNLLSNAMKFCYDRTPVIDISCTPVQDGWCLQVSDNGIGIAEEDLGRVFGMFQRLDRMRFPGFGIGLASVQRIAQLHGGSVEVSSQLGAGTTFTVLLTTRRD